MSVPKNSAPARATKAEEYLIKDEPYYEALGKETNVFEAAFRQRGRVGPPELGAITLFKEA